MRKISCALLLSAASLTVSAGPPIILITESEARLPVGDVPTSRGITRGPTIEVISPKSGTKANKPPLDFKVKFAAHGGAEIKPESVQIQYIKSPLVDLTERALPHISEKGISITGAVVPEGQHMMRISVQDTSGRWGFAVFSFNAVK